MKPASKIFNKRKHVRVRVQFRSHFSVKSLIAVQSGTELELCIFPGDDSNPIMIDVAVVRWTQPSEFGLSFVTIRAPFLRRLTEVWRKLASPF